MKIMRYFVFSMILMLLSFAAISCKEIISEDETDTNSTICEIRVALTDIAQENASSRTVIPEKLEQKELSYKLVAKKGSDDNKTFDWENYEKLINASFSLNAGEWSFTLYAYKTGRTDAAASSGEIKQTIVAGTNTLQFTMKETSEGVGSLCMDFIVGKTGFSAVTAELRASDGTSLKSENMGSDYNSEINGELVQSWNSEVFENEGFDGTVSFKITDNVPCGSYLIICSLTSTDGEERGFPTAVYVSPGNNSSGSYDATDSGTAVASFYSVFYDDGVDDETIGVPTDTALYKAGDTVKIKSFDVTRTGYIFDGWKRSESLVYNQPEDPNETTTFEMPGENVTLKANWKSSDSTAYTVRYWQQKLNDAKTAVLGEDKTITEPTIEGEKATCPHYEIVKATKQYGTTEAQTQSTVNSYPGFTVQNFTEQTIAANGSTIVDIFYNRNNDTDYTVKHYKQDLNEVNNRPGLTYTYISESKTSGITGTWTKATANSYTGFTVQDFDQKPIAEDGSTIVEIYYTRNTNTAYTVKHWLQNVIEAGTETSESYTLDSTEQMSGTTLGQTEAVAKTYTGFTPQFFTQTVIAENGTTVVNIRYSRNIDTAYTVRYWQQKLNDAKDAVLGVEKTITEPTIEGENAICSCYDFVEATTHHGMTGAQTKSTINSYPGFAVQEVTEQTIAADGSTIVDIFYNRKTDTAYTVTHYVQDLDSDNIGPGLTYTSTPEQKSGITGAWTNATANPHVGFTVQDFNQETIAADGSTIVEIRYTRNTNTAYTVKHWLQNLNGDLTGITNTHTEDESARETKSGTTLGATAAEAQTFIGFTAQNITQTTIAADGTTVVDIYYDRNSTTAYTVRHHLQNLNEAGTASSDSYRQNLTEPKTGITGTWTAAQAKETYTGFAKRDFNQKEIEPDGSSVVDIFYDRINYAVTYNDGVDGETIDVPVAAQWCYEATVTVSSFVPARTGYTFLGWGKVENASSADYNPEDTFTMGAAPVTLYALWKENALSGGNITLNWNDYTDMALFTCELTGTNKNILHFTGADGYETYAWWIGNASSAINGKTYDWNTSSVSSDTYDVTLVVTDSSGSPRSQTLTVVIGK